MTGLSLIAHYPYCLTYWETSLLHSKRPLSWFDQRTGYRSRGTWAGCQNQCPYTWRFVWSCRVGTQASAGLGRMRSQSTLRSHVYAGQKLGKQSKPCQIYSQSSELAYLSIPSARTFAVSSSQTSFDLMTLKWQHFLWFSVTLRRSFLSVTAESCWKHLHCCGSIHASWHDRISLARQSSSSWRARIDRDRRVAWAGERQTSQALQCPYGS